MAASLDLHGERFGRLLVTDGPLYHRGIRHWKCKCSCGDETTVAIGNLRSGKVRSCGCLRKEKSIQRFTIHGHARHRRRTPEYKIWCAMLSRCHNRNSGRYRDYGGRGIKVCSRWHDFAKFYSDMGPRPEPHLTIDREDNDGDYTPENARWATRAEQARNKRGAILIAHAGLVLPLRTWCERYGIKYTTAYQRYRRGLPFERIFEVKAVK